MADRKVIQLEDGAGNLYDVKDTEARAAIEALDENKAEIDGYYEELTAGSAEQLIASVGIHDKEPYVFRTAGGSADIGNRKNESIVGGTICWNQWVNNGNFANGTANFSGSRGTLSAANNELTYSVTTAEVASSGGNNYVVANYNCANGHKYLFSSDVFIPSNNQQLNKVRIGVRGAIVGGTTETGAWIKVSGISSTTAVNNIFIATTGSLAAVGDTFKLRNVNVFDLTAMFGSAIADYIYGLEQATAGAGVAWFKKLFPKPYYEYNAGELMSVKAAAMETVGFNAWDEDWFRCTYNDTTGVLTPSESSTIIGSKNFIPVIPNAVYSISRPSNVHVYGYYYDSEYNYVDVITLTQTFTIPDNVTYLKFYTGSAYGAVYNNDICINLSWDGERDGEYEAYIKRTYPLDSSLELRGIPKLDANNSLYYDGDTYEPDGTVTRRYGIVDLGTLTWTYNSSSLRFDAGSLSVTPNPVTRYQIPNAICTKYTNAIWDGNGTTSSGADKAIMFDSTNLRIRDTSYSDAATFKTAMSGVMLVYEVYTPTTEEAEPFQDPQVVDDFGTERFIDAAYEAEDRDVEMPVGHETYYQANLRAKLEMAPNSPDGNGDYIVRQTNGQNEYVPLVIPTELPTAPSENGTYTLKVTVADGTPTYSWVSG